MDIRKLAEMMSATLSEDKNQRESAEEHLKKVWKIPGFVPALLEIVMQNELQLPFRQATVVYMKNFITKNWAEKEVDGHSGQMEFAIHEQDKIVVRENIVDALVLAPDLIRSQISTCIYHIIKSDFPGRWPQIVNKIQQFLQTTDYNSWSGAILCLYQLVKNYEYKKADERAPLDEAMNILLPLMYGSMGILIKSNEQTNDRILLEKNTLLQKNILKIYHTLIHFCLPLDLITNDVFTQWMEICQYVIDMEVPIDVSNIDEDDRLELPWWKAKKWALHICFRTFERYGSPNNCVNKEYQKFAEWYLPTFTGGILESLLKVLQLYGSGKYVSPRVLTEVFNYIKVAVGHAHSWKVLKPYMLNIIQEIIFPIMQYNETDEDLYNNDTIEYIRRKFDIYDDCSTPVPAAQDLFLSCCKIRKGILPKAMEFLNTVILNQSNEPRKRDGALYMIGSVAEVLLKKKDYRDDLEAMLARHVFPEFGSPYGHMRARACWVLKSFTDIKFKNRDVMVEILRLATNALLTDPDLPVKVEAAIVLEIYLTSQDEAEEILKPHIEQITTQLLHIIRETELDDLNSALQTIVQTYSKELMPAAVEICKQLEELFSKILNDDDGADDRDEIAMGLLNTIKTLVSVFEENAIINANLQPCVIAVIRLILQRNSTYFYDEAFALVGDLTTKSISPEMWGMLTTIHDVFKQDAMDAFTDLMPALHNYITVDTPTFLSNPQYIEVILDICKTVLLNGEAGEDAECHAAKLIEVIILQCKGQIDHFIPRFVEVAVERLRKEPKSSELRTMCLQVLIAALYYNPILLLNLLQSAPNGAKITSDFIEAWLKDTDCFLGIHDRKLYVLGLCTAISLGSDKPQALVEFAPEILPNLLTIFEGLKRAYHTRAQEDEDDESDENEDEDCEEAISSDEDDVDEFNSYLNLDSIKNFATKKAAQEGVDMSAEIKEDDEDSDDDDDLSDYELDETALEVYVTPIDDEESENPIDEYIEFEKVMKSLNAKDPEFYGKLTKNLNQEQCAGLKDVMVLAVQKKSHYESKLIEKKGGYTFAPPSVPPTNFNFTS